VRSAGREGDAGGQKQQSDEFHATRDVEYGASVTPNKTVNICARLA
jgi:hypothetical protein